MYVKVSRQSVKVTFLFVNLKLRSSLCVPFNVATIYSIVVWIIYSSTVDRELLTKYLFTLDYKFK